MKQFSTEIHNNKNKIAALILIDPFGMQVNWDTISSFSGTRTDFWILVPSGVIINRLLDNNGELIYHEKLEEFFGLKKDDILKIFYSKKNESNLFGEEFEIVRKVTEPIEKITGFYIQRLKLIWKFVPDKKLVLYNSKRVPIYHFVFASNNSVGNKIASYIIDNI